jgi:rhodanese-related sulfurtransferase
VDPVSGPLALATGRVGFAACSAAGVVLAGLVLGLLANMLSPSGLSLVAHLTPPGCALDSGEARTAQVEGAVFLDGRLPDAFVEGHVPGALNVPYAERERLLGLLVDRLAPSHRVVVYCYDSRCGLADLLDSWLRYHGWGNVCVMRGGMVEWRRAGLPVETGERKR